MNKSVNNTTVLVVKSHHWNQIHRQIKDWLNQQNIKVNALMIPPNYETVAVRFASDSDLVAFKMVWGAKLDVND